jgi:hypothetical protein
VSAHSPLAVRFLVVSMVLADACNNDAFTFCMSHLFFLVDVTVTAWVDDVIVSGGCIVCLRFDTCEESMAHRHFYYESGLSEIFFFEKPKKIHVEPAILFGQVSKKTVVTALFCAFTNQNGLPSASKSKR